MNEVKGLDDCDLIVGVGLFEEDENEGVEEFLIGEQAGSGLAHRLGVLRNCPCLHLN